MNVTTEKPNQIGQHAVLVDGEKIGYVKQYGNRNWGFALTRAGQYGNGSGYKTKAAAVATVAASAGREGL